MSRYAYAPWLWLVCLAGPVAAQLDADFDALPVSGVNPLRVTFTDASQGRVPDTYIWDFGDGGVSIDANPTHTYLAPGQYSVSLTVSVAGFPVQTDTETKVGFISVEPAPLEVGFEVSGASGLNPLRVTFTDLTSGPVTSWLWDFGDGNSSTEQNPSHIYTLPGLHDVSLTACVQQQCQTLVERGLVHVEPVALVPGFLAGPTRGPEPHTVSFADLSEGGPVTSWLWEFGDGNTSTVHEPSHTYQQPGQYDVSLTVFSGQQAEPLVKSGLIHVDPGPFSPKLVINGQANGVRDVHGADLDGDGDLDVLVASEADDQISWHENLDGRGSFGPEHVLPTFAQQAQTVRTADLDGDGDLDVLSASQGNDRVAWNPNLDGRGTFGATQVLANDLLLAEFVRPADLDGDHDLDVLAAGCCEVRWFENLGRGTFAPGRTITTSFGRGGLAEGDVDGDGDLDVFAAASSLIAWSGNRDGHGDFGTPQVISFATKRLETLHGADVDVDGDFDLLSGSSSNETVLSKVRMYDNTDGAGTYVIRQDLLVDFDEVTDIDTGDLDLDGDLDVVSSLGFSGSIRWSGNLEGLGRFGPSTLLTEPSNAWASAVEAVDLDGDGDLDVLFGRGSNVLWFRNDMNRPERRR